MDFDKLKTDIKNLILETTRTNNDDYFEAVIKKEHLGKTISALEAIFGPPAYPSQKGLSKEAKKSIENDGGIRRGQTLYFMNKEGRSMFAMLWPWQDGERITIKMRSVS